MLQPSSSSSNTTTEPHYGLRAQLHSLLPRHAYFHVHIHVHQLSSVPLVSGEFALRWKFKNVHSIPGSKHTILGIGLPRSRPDSAKKDDEDEEDSIQPEQLTPTATERGHFLPSLSRERRQSGTASTMTPSQSSASLHNQRRSVDWSQSPSSSASSSSVLSPTSATSINPSTTSRADTISSLASASTTSTTYSHTSTSTTSTSAPIYAPARGLTPFVKLKDHNVTWEQSIFTTLRMDVDRSSSLLLPSPLKLVVTQRVIPDDPDAPSNPRLGAVYLDLAQYAGAGEVQRRYLLRESKTNATLKLTLHLTHVSGEPHFKPPPLPQGEILTGITNLLQTPAYRARPAAKLDMYGPYGDQMDLEMDLLGAGRSGAITDEPEQVGESGEPEGAVDAEDVEIGDRGKGGKRKHKKHWDPNQENDDTQQGQSLTVDGGDNDRGSGRSRAQKLRRPSPSRQHSQQQDIEIRPGSRNPSRPQTPSPPLHAPGTPSSGAFGEAPLPFDVDRLPLAYGTRTTETLIEALFNPIKVEEKRRESPFTVYVAPSRPPSRAVSGAGSGVHPSVPLGRRHVSWTRQNSANGEEVASLLSAESAGTGAISMTTTSGSGGAVSGGSSFVSADAGRGQGDGDDSVSGHGRGYSVESVEFGVMKNPLSVRERDRSRSVSRNGSRKGKSDDGHQSMRAGLGALANADASGSGSGSGGGVFGWWKRRHGREEVVS